MKFQDGQTCTYCKRVMHKSDPKDQLYATRDHVTPKKHVKKIKLVENNVVWCCQRCNNKKSGRSIKEWEDFMKRNPGWWMHQLF